MHLWEIFQADSFALNSKAKMLGIAPDKSSAYPDEMNWDKILIHIQTILNHEKYTIMQHFIMSFNFLFNRVWF